MSEKERDLKDAQPLNFRGEKQSDCDPTGDCASDCGCGSECGEGACAASCGCECGGNGGDGS